MSLMQNLIVIIVFIKANNNNIIIEIEFSLDFTNC